MGWSWTLEFTHALLVIQTAVCGDGFVWNTDGGSEECDDGNTTPGDGCDENCKTEVCGNGLVQSGEDCDDGGTATGDGCDENCKVGSDVLR